MRVAFGLKVHSGWAALVVLGSREGTLHVVDRCRLVLVDPGEASWAKQPYHAASGLSRGEARSLVRKGIASARRIAVRALREAVARADHGGDEVIACAVLVGAPLPNWTIDECLAVHIRMHRAEGWLFRDALARAAETCGLRLVEIREKDLAARAKQALAIPPAGLQKTITKMGKALGPPWGRDQKDAAVAALTALLES